MWLHDRRLIIVLGTLWILGIGAGIGKLLAYECTPAITTALKPMWPVGTQLKRRSGEFTLVMAVHPQCPCSRASLDELAVLTARCRNLSSNLLFAQPSGCSEAWLKSDLWRQAQAIPAVKLVADQQSKEARLFGALTSGEVAVYDPSGSLIFHGGITAARGHIGDNNGLDAIVALVNRRNAGITQTPVFGCALLGNGNVSDETN